MKLKTLADKLTVAFIYLLVVEIAVSLALAINFMYDYHFFTADSNVYPMQKVMGLKTEKEYNQLEEFISLYLKKEVSEQNGESLSKEEQASYENFSRKYSVDNTNLVFIANLENGAYNVKNDEKPQDFCFSNQKPLNLYVENIGVLNGTIQIFVRSEKSMNVQDGYSLALEMINFAHSVRYLIFVLLFIVMCTAVFLLGVLMSSVGSSKEKKYYYFIDRIPFDLLSIIAAALIAFVIIMIILTSAADIKEESIVLWNAVILILTFVNSFILLVYCLTLAARIKKGHIFQNTIVYKIISKVRKKKNIENDGYFKVPILGKALIITGLVMLLELVLIFVFVYKYKTCLSGRLEDFKFLTFAFSQVAVLFVLGALFLMIVINLSRVRESGKKIASGDFDGVIDSHIMFGDFKAINDDLITIKDDMIQALEDKNKSQEMRNELITNISHDIKTPLTSIVNYADIISSGKCDPEEIKSYSDIITKQSSKLNDLLFNLIEVSKISSGAVTVNYDSVNVKLFLSQTLEEFTFKFNEKNLTVEQNMPEEDIYINADGMKLWRVFENLFSNIVKYAMPNSRVHLDVECRNKKVFITLRNISEKPISSTSDELLVRFKRDDGSRHTEGNGLGLSIAKSFVEIQQGTFEIFVDAELFKTVITFNELEKPSSDNQ